MHIVLFGRFGIGDVDEDATARIVARALRARSPDVSLSVASFARAPLNGLDVQFVDAADDTAVQSAIASASLVVAAGTPLHGATEWRLEDLFGAETPTPATAVARAMLRAVAAGVPSALFAIGVAPLGTDGARHVVALLAALAAHVSVRDAESAEALRAAGFTGSLAVTADPAFGVVPEAALVPTPRRRPLRLGVMPSPSTATDGLRAIGGAVRALAVRRPLEVLVPSAFETTSLALDAADVVRVDATEPAAIARWLGSCDVVVTTSVPVAVLAAVAGTPTVGIGADPALHAHTRAAVGADVALDPAGCTPDTIARVIEQAVDGRTTVATHLVARVEVARTVLGGDYDALLAAARTANASTEQQRIAGLEQVCQRLRSRLEQREESWRTLAAFLGREVEVIAPISTGVTQRSRDIDVFRRRAESAEAELAAIKRTRGWRLLHSYGVLKHHYVFPAARFLTRRKRPTTAGRDTAEAMAIAVPPGTLDVVCFPIIDWDFRFQRPQQLMTRFAAAGHRVFYVEPRFAPSAASAAVTVKTPNVYHATLAGPARDVWKDALDPETRDDLFASLNRLRIDRGLGATLVVVQLPFWWPLAALARQRFAWPIAYDCMDEHAGFATYTGATAADEEALFAEADFVSVSSLALAERARRYREQVLLLRNGCEFEHFATAATLRARRTRPVIGFYGAIAHWFDGDLVADLAERRPDWDFVLVGSTHTGDVTRLEKLPNVRLPGEQPYTDLPAWLATFDVTVLPFKRTPLTEATNPVKAYEILASGRPIVSVPLPEMRLLGDLVRLAETPAEFEREIVAALDPADAAHADARRAYAAANTWNARYDELAANIPSVFPRASTVIVTYNNLALNRDCLEHLFARTEWPNHEVIVVDNASTDGTREYLGGLAATRPGLVLIANDRNLGFAAACNQGLARATGAYLVLLNNDTVVTRGWLSTLIRHLHAMPDVGLIGPVTNEIGNEAKVPVGYADLADMPGWAARFTREHADRLRSMTMLAMFCVAMRRSTLEDVGVLDERFVIGMFEDDDYARRMHRRGYRVVTAMDAFVHHVGGASFKRLDEGHYRALFERNRHAFERKWGAWARHQDDAAAPHVATLRRRLQEIVDAAGVASDDIVVFPRLMREPTEHTSRAQRVAVALAEHGMLVFIDDGWDGDGDHDGFDALAPNVWRYRGLRGTLECLEAPFVWVFAYNALEAFRWLGGILVYDATDDPSAFPVDPDVLREHHERMLREAAMVICSPAATCASAAKHPNVVQLATPPIATAHAASGDHTGEPTESAFGRGLVDLLRARRPSGGGV